MFLGHAGVTAKGMHSGHIGASTTRESGHRCRVTYESGRRRRMLFRMSFLTGIQSGDIRLAFRRWQRPTVRAGDLCAKLGMTDAS